MQAKIAVQRLIILVVISTVALVLGGQRQAANATPTGAINVPRVWDDAVELPLADTMATPKHIAADYCYRIPVRPIYKSYPVYALGSEQQGYQEWINQQEPQTLFDSSKLKVAEDWSQLASGPSIAASEHSGTETSYSNFRDGVTVSHSAAANNATTPAKSKARTHPKC